MLKSYIRTDFFKFLVVFKSHLKGNPYHEIMLAIIFSLRVQPVNFHW